MTADVIVRRDYLGGGMIAAVLGLSPWHSPLDAYLSLTEGEREISTEKRQFFEDRRDLEPWACKKFTRRTGHEITRTNHRYDDATLPWAKAEIDAETFIGNVEIKTVNPDVRWMWPEQDSGEEPPLYVTAQAMWGLGITGRDLCYVYALIGFDEDRVYDVPRNEALIEDIRDRARFFWTHHVEKKRPPQPTTLDDLKRLYPRDSGRIVEATDEVATLLERRSVLKQQIKLAENQALLAEFSIKDAMRDATLLTVRGKTVATWKQDKRGVRIFRTV